MSCARGGLSPVISFVSDFDQHDQSPALRENSENFVATAPASHETRLLCLVSQVYEQGVHLSFLTTYPLLPGLNLNQEITTRKRTMSNEGPCFSELQVSQ